MQQNVNATIKEMNWIYIYIAWEDVHDVATMKKKVVRVLCMICPVIFKGASPTCAIICLCDLVNRQKDIPGFNSGFLLWLWWEQGQKEIYFCVA